MAMLVIDPESKKLSYQNQAVGNLYDFLKANNIDVVINQIAYSTWLLEEFLKQGGARWKSEGGRIISQLHFAPKIPSAHFLARVSDNGSLQSKIQILKTQILAKRYERKDNQAAARVFEYIYNNSDYFVTLSPTHFSYMKSVWHRNEYDRLVAINNPLTFDTISNVAISESKEKIVLVVARMSEFHKRISICLKAWKRINDKRLVDEWKLLIVGDGPNLQNYKKYVIDNNLKNVFFEGQKSPEKYYERASIFLMTSSAEGWGLTLTESLQRGVVPVVMNTSPVFDEIIENEISGVLVKENDFKSFCSSIVKLIQDDKYRIAMSLSCLKQAEKFTLDTTIDKWMKLIGKE